MKTKKYDSVEIQGDDGKKDYLAVWELTNRKHNNASKKNLKNLIKVFYGYQVFQEIPSASGLTIMLP